MQPVHDGINGELFDYEYVHPPENGRSRASHDGRPAGRSGWHAAGVLGGRPPDDTAVLGVVPPGPIPR